MRLGPWEVAYQMPGDFMMCMGMSGNGVWTGYHPTQMQFKGTPKAHLLVLGAYGGVADTLTMRAVAGQLSAGGMTHLTASEILVFGWQQVD